MLKAVFTVLALGVILAWMVPDRNSAAPSRAAVAAARSGPSAPTRIQRSRDGHFYVHAMVNGQLVRFLVDTGATGIALTEEDAERVGEDVSPSSYEVVGRGASGDVRGARIRLESVDLDGKAVSDVSGIVAEGLDISLLGQSYLSRMQSVQMNADEMVIR